MIGTDVFEMIYVCSADRSREFCGTVRTVKVSFVLFSKEESDPVTSRGTTRRTTKPKCPLICIMIVVDLLYRAFLNPL